jgi:hypothetical protein
MKTHLWYARYSPTPVLADRRYLPLGISTAETTRSCPSKPYFGSVVSDDQRVTRQVSLHPVRSKPEALPEQPSQLLKPGGILVFEHLMDDSGSERAASWLPKPNGLFEVFGRLRIRRYEDT